LQIGITAASGSSRLRESGHQEVCSLLVVYITTIISFYRF